jgi:histidinol-phosphate/aromatic aminotransferase/cobyric acid decarboxylase-like protein
LTAAATNDVECIDVPLDSSFDLRVDEILKVLNKPNRSTHAVLELAFCSQAATANTKLMFLCSPGNPTAKLLRP